MINSTFIVPLNMAPAPPLHHPDHVVAFLLRAFDCSGPLVSFLAAVWRGALAFRLSEWWLEQKGEKGWEKEGNQDGGGGNRRHAAGGMFTVIEGGQERHGGSEAEGERKRGKIGGRRRKDRTC